VKRRLSDDVRRVTSGCTNLTHMKKHFDVVLQSQSTTAPWSCTGAAVAGGLCGGRPEAGRAARRVPGLPHGAAGLGPRQRGYKMFGPS